MYYRLLYVEDAVYKLSSTDKSKLTSRYTKNKKERNPNM